MTASFTRAVREELARVTDSRQCCRLAEVAGLVRTTGSFHIRGGVTDEERYGLHLATTVQAAARLVYSHFKAFGAEGQLRTRRESALPAAPGLRGAPGRLSGHPAGPQRAGGAQRLLPSGVGNTREAAEETLLPSSLPARLSHRGGFGEPAPQEAHLEILTPHDDFAADLVGLLEAWSSIPGSTSGAAATSSTSRGARRWPSCWHSSGAQEAALQVEEQAVHQGRAGAGEPAGQLR